MYKQENSRGVTMYLNTKIVKFGGADRSIYYFSKDERETACDLPKGMEVAENSKNGMLMAKKIK